MHRVRAILVLLAVGVGLAGLFPEPIRAQADPKPEVLAADILGRARDRYAAARELYAKFDGSSLILGEAVPVTGRLAYRRPDASSHEFRFEGPNARRIVFVIADGRKQQWIFRGKEETKHVDDPFEGEKVEVPMLPAFDVYDPATIKFVEHRRSPGKPTVHVVEARFKRPGDPFTAARLGVEDGTWLIRTLDLIGPHRAGGAGGGSAEAPLTSLRFTEILIDGGLPPDAFKAPVAR